jgi:hypothetical protein
MPIVDAGAADSRRTGRPSNSISEGKRRKMIPTAAAQPSGHFTVFVPVRLSLEVPVLGNQANDVKPCASVRHTAVDVAERSGHCFVGPGCSNRLEDLRDRGFEEEKNPLGHGPTVHLHGEFTAVPVHHFHFDSRFFPQRVRQTGGMLSGTGSGRAFSNSYLFHL